MTVSTVDVLRAARDLYAQAPSHVPSPQIPEPGTYCILTATYEAGTSLHDGCAGGGADIALRHAAKTDRLVQWNAEHSTEEVLEAFDRAIEAEALKVVTA